ncbi:MAG: hypothetical protein L6428_00285 [Candidatus Aminicenantes bacterium]|nr:hypothetical protein [Acidobacteriota bacterium]MCG2809879.1 hypothetical protein [Candidatus Aminicenantes bacterium]
MKKSILLSMMMIIISSPAFAGSDGEAGPGHLFDDAFTTFAVSEPYEPRIIPNKTIGRRPSVGGMIMAGVLGNIVGSLAGCYLGAPSFDEHDVLPFISCWAAGSAIGSSAGASLAGYSRDWKGSLGMATIGAALGVGLSWLLVSSPTLQENAGMLSLVPLLILPPIGAAVFFNSSMRPRQLPVNHALLNISAGRLGLGVPEVQVRPIFAPGCGTKPEMQFKVNVLSVKL